jgi:hypothetical protein
VTGKVELEATKPTRYSYPKQVFIALERILNNFHSDVFNCILIFSMFQPASRNSVSEAGRVSYDVNGVSRLMKLHLNLC